MTGGRFVKGQSGNPGGRPSKAVSFAESLRAQLEQVKNSTSTRDRLAASVIEMALKGNLDAVKWLVDRVDGKLPDRVETDNTHRHEHDVAETTLDALAERWLRLRGDGSP